MGRNKGRKAGMLEGLPLPYLKLQALHLVSPGLGGSRCFLPGQLLPLHHSPPHILLLLVAMPLGALSPFIALIRGNAYVLMSSPT